MYATFVIYCKLETEISLDAANGVVQMKFLRRDTEDTSFKTAAKVFLLLFPIALFFMIYFHPNPYLRIDLDYHFTLNALMNHGTPDLRPADFEGEWMVKIMQSHNDPWYCMRPNEKGTVYGDHFWLWPLICTPAGLVFRALGKPPLMAHALMIGALLWATLLLAWKYLEIDPARKFAFITAAGITPALFYIQVLGSEGFCYIAMLASVIPLSRRRYEIAAAFAALASLQNSSMGIYAILLAVFYLATRPPRLKHFLIAALALSPALISPLFYFVTFGRPTLFAGVTPLSIRDISSGLFLTHLFDLNAGLILFIPAMIVLYFAACIRQTVRLFKGSFYHEFFSPDMAALLGAFFIPLSASVWINWNSGYFGPMRHAVYIIPLLLWISVSFTKRTALASSALCIVVTALWITFGGWFADFEDKGYQEWGPFARTALKYAPRTCSVWSDEIMFERTRGGPYGYRELEGGSRRLLPELPVCPIIYYDAEWGPRKILTTSEGWKTFREGIIFEKPEMFAFIDKAFAQGNTDKNIPRYFNMPAFRSAGAVIKKEIPAGDIKYTIRLDAATQYAPRERVSYDVTLVNDSAVPLVALPKNAKTEQAFNVLLALSRVKPGTEYKKGDSLDVAVHAQLTIPDTIPRGASMLIPIEIEMPAAGEYMLVAMLGQGRDYLITEDAHSWFRQKITVKETDG